MNCNDCSRTLHEDRAWRSMPREERVAIRATDAMFSGRGLCHGCHARARRTGTLIDYETQVRPWAQVLEDWRRLADPERSRIENVRRIAPRVGMTVDALERAVTRHREDVAA